MIFFVPNLFIPGVAKCGTSTLHEMLNQHPDICMSSRKEPHFWTDLQFENFTQKNIDSYQSLFSDSKATFFGESSTGSMFFPELFIKRVQEHSTHHIKFIIILRNPIDRTYSHYWWCKGSGRERRNFRKAIKDDKQSSFTYYPDWPKYYYQFSIYSRWLIPFLEAFGTANIKVITLENLQTSPKETLNSCFTFLGLKELETIAPNLSNETIIVKHGTIYNLSRRISQGDFKFTKIAKYLIPISLIDKIRILLNEKLFNFLKTNKKYPKLSAKERMWLKKMYSNEITTLEQLLKREFREWKDFY